MQLLLKRKLCEFYVIYDAEFYQLIGQDFDKFFANLKNLSVLKYLVLNQQVNKQQLEAFRDWFSISKG